MWRITLSSCCLLLTLIAVCPPATDGHIGSATFRLGSGQTQRLTLLNKKGKETGGVLIVAEAIYTYLDNFAVCASATVDTSAI